MTEGEIFFFGVVNFALLIGGLVWGLRKSARQFFYARRVTLQKQMAEAAAKLSDARTRVAGSRDLSARLASEIERRKKQIADGCGKECRAILDNAARTADRLLATADRQMNEESARSVRGVQRRILAEAFRDAEIKLMAGLEPEAKQRMLDRGLRELAKLDSDQLAAAE